MYYSMKLKRGVSLALFVITLMSATVSGQYVVGEAISQATKDRVVTYCANGVGSETIGELLVPTSGEPTRVLWLNFFASW